MLIFAIFFTRVSNINENYNYISFRSSLLIFSLITKFNYRASFRCASSCCDAARLCFLCPTCNGGFDRSGRIQQPTRKTTMRAPTKITTPSKTSNTISSMTSKRRRQFHWRHQKHRPVRKMLTGTSWVLSQSLLSDSLSSLSRLAKLVQWSR